jgi:hypothetical protein
VAGPCRSPGFKVPFEPAVASALVIARRYDELIPASVA